jgi:hypothetical protein
MQDPLNYARFIELAWLLGPKAFSYGKIAPPPIIILLKCVVEAGLQPKKG